MSFEVEVFVADDGSCPFSEWFNRLPPRVADRVDTAVERMKLGNFGDWRSVGEGVREHRLHFGPG